MNKRIVLKMPIFVVILIASMIAGTFIIPMLPPPISDFFKKFSGKE